MGADSAEKQCVSIRPSQINEAGMSDGGRSRRGTVSRGTVRSYAASPPLSTAQVSSVAAM